MYPNIVSLGSLNQDGFYRNDEADILLNNTTGWFAAALVRANVAASVGGGSRAFFSSTDAGNRGVRLHLGTTADNILELTWAIGTGVTFVVTTISLKPATCVGKILMPWAIWNGTNFIVGVNGEQFASTPAATFANNTVEGMFIGTAITGAPTDLDTFGEVSAIGFINTQVLDADAVGFASAFYAASERLNDLSTDGAILPDLPNTEFDYLISMQRQGHSGLQPTFANLGTANGGTFTLHATEDTELTLRTSPTHWACPVEAEVVPPIP